MTGSRSDEMKQLFNEAVAYGLFDNIDAKIAMYETMADMAKTDSIRARWEEKAQEYRQLRADAQLQIAMNNHRAGDE